jgi:hypothetical protein
MRCPACRNTLEQRESGGIRLDVCRACGGIWFDRFEMKKMDEPFEPASDEILNVEGNDPVRPDPTQRRKCPRCDDLVMMRHHFSVERVVELDECPGCGGVWLDQGELAKIRSLFSSEAEKDDAAKKQFAERFDSALGRMRAESRESRERARRFARLFRFLCPSSYVPGKQGWGAF